MSDVAASQARQDATGELIDALSSPNGRSVRRAWDNACPLHGRVGAVMMRSSFEAYLDELAGMERNR